MAGLQEAKTPQLCLEQARHQFAAGHPRQGIELVVRAIDMDREATDAGLDALWDQPVLARLPNVLRHVLTRFEAQSSEYKAYQWLLTLTFHATGNRQMGLRLLGQAINAQKSSERPMIGSQQILGTDHWLRLHDMPDVGQPDFWTGADADATVGEGISRARRHFIEGMNLAGEHLDEMLPLLTSVLGGEREILACLSAPQTLRLLALHAGGQRGLTLSEDEVRAMISTLSEQQRLDHLGRAVAFGDAFHVSALLASGVVLSDVRAEMVGSRTCQSPYLVEELIDSGMSTDRLADLLVAGPMGDGPIGQPLPAQSLERLLQRQLSPDHRIGGKANGPTLLWEAVRRKDAAAVTLLRHHGADCNTIMQVTHPDGSQGNTTPGIFALAQGDARVMRAMRMTDASALLPGIQMMLSAVRQIS